VLSRFPILARRAHTNDNYLLDGRRMSGSRGIFALDVQAATSFTFTLIAARLKSRRPVPAAAHLLTLGIRAHDY